jgi:hypothetical protein
MEALDFSTIRGLAQGQRYSFEEMICQLARREPVPHGATFRRVEGSGGDGGVEGYWLLPNGSKYGYQAKFFTRTKEINWAQIDDSVYEALKNHPTLTRYVVAIPCDLTDRSGASGKGRTGWQHWETHKRKWLSRRAQRRPKIDFVIWTAFELRNALIAPLADGLRRYWFGREEFSPEWFSSHVNAGIAALDERYHPEDHVDVAIERLFGFVCRSEDAVRQLRDAVTEIEDKSIPDSYFKQLGDKDRLAELGAITNAVNEISSIKSEFYSPSWQLWNSIGWKRLSEQSLEAIGKLVEWTWQERSKISKQDYDKRARFESAVYALSNLYRAAEKLGAVLGSRYLEAERKRTCIIEGRAGTGKSHLLAKIAQVALQEGRPIILLLGQQFNEQPIWSQISNRLGLSSIDAESLLQALDAAAQAVHKRGIILVDAINEGAGARIWRNEIASFLAQVAHYPNLACFISCRSEYVHYTIPNGVLSEVPRFEIRGFETPKEQLEAAKVYMDKRGIARPGVPWLAPEFVNPLFLRSACLALAQEGMSEFPRGLTGTKAILAFYLKSVGRHLGVGRDGTDELAPNTARALRTLAGQMACNRKDYVSKPNGCRRGVGRN